MSAGYLNARHAAAYVDKTYKAFDMAVRRHGIPFKWFGGRRLFRTADLDAAIEAMSQQPAKLRMVASR